MYRWVRHPIYAGLFLASAGRTVAAGDRRQLGLTAMLAAVLTFKAGFEDGHGDTGSPGSPARAATTPRFLLGGADTPLKPDRCPRS